MEKQISWLLIAVFLGASFLVGHMLELAPAAAAPVILEVYDPTGAYEVTQLHAPRLTDLNGKTICEIANYNWEWKRTFPIVTELLKRQFPTAKIIPWDQTIVSRTDLEDLDKVAKVVKEKGCQGAIIGNAG